MRLLEGRRLTGPNHLGRTPLVVVEVTLDPDEDLARAAAAFSVELGRMRTALGLAEAPELHVRAHRGGAAFAYEAPRDTMLAAVEASEWAAASASAVLAGDGEASLEPRRTEIAAMLAEQDNPALRALLAEAERRDAPFLWDDETASFGYGRGSVSYPLASLPAPADVPWSTLRRIPIAVVTGTNGKTTSSRLLAHVAKTAGLVVGSTSTDGVVLGDRIVERGDWTGPIAARLVLRDETVELAVLETARGGILRRGLAYPSCDAALITNIAADHLGDYGIDDLAAMAHAKGVTAHAVKAGGTVVLNARDPNLRTLGAEVVANVIWFADLEAEGAEVHAFVAAHRAAGGTAVLARQGAIVIAAAAESELLRVDDVPLTFGGAARYNVENVLGVVGMAHGLGLAADVIARGLRTFRMEDNPGRGQLFERGGVKILLDFGHNPDGVRSVMQLVATLRGAGSGKLFVIAGSPGDRSNADIEGVVQAIAAARPERVFVRELLDYLRGRALGEVPGLYARMLREHGVADGVFVATDDEVSSLRAALTLAAPGDLVVLLVHMDQAEVAAFLASADPSPG